jgi:hypothetical protein
MILVLRSVIVAVTMIVVAISMMRHRISSGSLIRIGIGKEGFSMKGEIAELSAARNPLKAFLIVALPDGRIVTPTVAGQI